jgi:hypothetical protein
MQDRRLCRSDDRERALQLLVEHVSRAAGGRGVALVDDGGRLLAGAGRAGEVWAVVRGVAEESPGQGTARAYIEVADEKLRLAAPRHAMGAEILAGAARAVGRILESTASV